MSRTGTTQSPDWKDGFLFLGNHLALDFVNTRPVMKGGAMELLPDFDALLRWFRAAGLLSSSESASLWQRWGESARARNTVKAMQDLRETLRKGIHSWERGAGVRRSTITDLNRLLAVHPMRTRLKASGRGTEQYFQPQQPEDLFTPLAYSAATLFANADPRRARKCDQCVLHFYDTSKKGTRRWCSMRICGNRKKVAAYAIRQRMRHRR